MSAKIIDGKEIAAKLREETKDRIQLIHKVTDISRPPCLAIVQANSNSASDTYVRNKTKACKEVGIKTRVFHFDETISQDNLLKCIAALNADDTVDGILVQSPMYEHINESVIFNAIDPNKDVDGFSAHNAGLLLENPNKYPAFPSIHPDIYPCTPAGIIYMLKSIPVQIAGKHCVIVGRSKIVGRPLAMMLLNEDATVTICHSKTANLKQICREADILIVAIGKANYITSDYVKPSAVVIDVGINRNADGKLCGDVDFEDVSKVAAAITPVPGGVGPLTVAMLTANTANYWYIRWQEKHQIRHFDYRDTYSSGECIYDSPIEGQLNLVTDSRGNFVGYSECVKGE